VAGPALILIAAPDKALRHSLVFGLASAGFAVDVHRRAPYAFASRAAGAAVCAVIDDDAICDWHLASNQFAQFGRPVILLVGSARDVPALPRMCRLVKPFLGEPLIEAVRNAIAGAT
jgi:hypothetical protein